MSNNIKTWADGYGRWHVEVPDTPVSLFEAVTAITNELFSRSHKDVSYGKLRQYVKSEIREVPCETPGQRRFIEYGID